MTNPIREPVLPHFARAGNLPFVALSDTLHAYRVDRSRALPLLIETWSRPLPQRDARGVQALQVVEDVVVATFQEPDSDGVRAQAISAQNGELIWETRVATAARDVAVADSADTGQHVVARTGSGLMFLLARRDAGNNSSSPAAEPTSDDWPSVLLDLPPATSPTQFTGDGAAAAYISDGGTRIRTVSTRDWKPLGPVLETPPASSPLTLYEGPLVIIAPEATERPAGRWAFFVTATRAIEVRRLDGGDDDIHGVRMPATSTRDEPWPWAPLVLNGEHVLVAHPQGVVCRVEVRRLEGIAHLFPAVHRTDLPRLAAPPIALGPHVLCVGRDGHCLLLDPATLRTVHDWQAPGPIDGGVAADRDFVFLGLEGRRLQAVRLNEMELLPAWQRPLEDGDWQVAGVVRGFLFVADSAGRILALDPASGQTVWSHTAPAPLALPPASVGNEIVFATIDGGLFFVSGPKAR